MTLEEIRDKKLGAVINTKTKHEAMLLVKILGVDKNRFYDETDFIDVWDAFKENTCYRVVDGKVDMSDCVKYYQNINEKIYELSDLFATGGVVSIHDLPTSEWYNPMRIDLPEFAFDAEQAKELAERLNKELAGRFNAFPNNGISAKNGGKNSMKFTFYTEEGYRIDKSNNSKVETITTFIKINGFDNTYLGMATCDKVDYSERDGILNAIANAVLGGNFDREYEKFLADKKRKYDESCKCKICGRNYYEDEKTGKRTPFTPEDARKHEEWHEQNKKNKREKYLIRKEAKRRLAEAEREGKIEQTMKELYKK